MPDPSSYMLILAGIGLHVGYQFLLMASYDAGDLTQIYPLARGSAPFIVALVSVALLGVSLQPVGLGANALIGKRDAVTTRDDRLEDGEGPPESGPQPSVGGSLEFSRKRDCEVAAHAVAVVLDPGVAGRLVFEMIASRQVARF